MIEDILTGNEIALVRQTLKHFLMDPDYASGEEDGITFDELEFGQSLPLELVLRDWNSDLYEGTGGMDFQNGDCYRIYKKLYLGTPSNNPDLGDFLK